MHCFFGHKWLEIQRHAMRVMDVKRDSDIPVDFETAFLFKCSKCGEIKSQTLKGFFDKDDDDGDDREPPTSPKCPDDMFDLLETK